MPASEVQCGEGGAEPRLGDSVEQVVARTHFYLNPFVLADYKHIAQFFGG